MPMTGACACGAVRYELDGTPFHRTLCQCVDCRRAAGAPVVAWCSVRVHQLRWVRGEPRRHRSSPAVERSFCGDCGTPLSYRSDAWPDQVDITMCSLDDPEALAPADHTFSAQGLSWMRLADGLPDYPRTRREGHARP